MNRLRPLLASALGLALAACTNGAAGAPILANPVPPAPSIPARTAPPVGIADPLPVVLPRDDGPHDRLTEWWYYTGHLRAEGGARYGFEFVVFRAERGSFPTSWVSHLAITDETGSRFLYSQRLSVGTQVDRSPTGADGRPVGFDLSLAGADPSRPESFGRPAWTMSGGGGIDHLSATLAPDEAVSAGSPGGLGLDLRLAATKPASLHDRDGWIDFGPAGGSYYYSRTAMQALGTLTVDGHAMTVDGAAWFDHQWGDFISVARDGLARHLERDAFSVEVTGRWVSPATGADYPAGWTIQIPADDLAITLRPTVADQELDTRRTTGVVYWEGSQVVRATRSGKPVGGEGYVELTGYATTLGPGR